MKKLYFGHPINIYGTELEEKLTSVIARYFPAWEIESPNQSQHQEGYKAWKQKTGSGMDYYFNDVLPKCQGGIFLPFRDGKWGAGVFGEAEFLQGRGMPIWEITHTGLFNFIISWESVVKRALSIDQTRLRVYEITGQIKTY